MPTWLMQAVSSLSGHMVAWRVTQAAPDWTGVHFPSGNGTPSYIAATKVVVNAAITSAS